VPAKNMQNFQTKEQNCFVYCWTDKESDKLYVGFHKGSVDDGYICSSKHVKAQYKIRPQDFSRQIIAIGSYDDCRKFESLLIRKMLDEGIACYNLNVNGAVVYTQEVRQKISAANKGKKLSAEHLAALRRWSAESRQPTSQETKEKIRQSKLGVKRAPFSEEWKRKIAEASSKWKRPPEFGQAVTARQTGSKRGPYPEEAKQKLREIMTGRKHSAETIAKLKEIKGNVSQETRDRLSAAKKAYWDKKRAEKTNGS
jgi:shikimate kinase